MKKTGGGRVGKFEAHEVVAVDPKIGKKVCESVLKAWAFGNLDRVGLL